jgi:hypothetical protein
MSIAPSRRLPAFVSHAALIVTLLFAVPAASVESGSTIPAAPAMTQPTPPAAAATPPAATSAPVAPAPNASMARPSAPAAAEPAPPVPPAPIPPAPSAAPAAPAAPAVVATPPAAPAAPAVVAAPPAAGGIEDDTARYLAGMQPSPGSPIAALTREEGWRETARFFDRAFGELDRTQLSRIRAWSKAQLRVRQSTMLYMFSGPDFLYADAFFPDASTYVLAGLEPVGQIPDLLRTPRGSLGPSLRSMANSLHSVLNFSFFKTHDMREELAAGRLGGTTPILFVFLARAGKIVHSATLVSIDAHGVEHAESERVKSAVHGVKIVFSGEDGRRQILYYFSTNLADDGFSRSGFMQFCERLGPTDSLVKSASYLMHHAGFTKVRDFLLRHSATLLEDDSGIPLAYFDRSKWSLHPFGRYIPPLDIFPNTYQPRLAELFRRATPINFGIGYRWRANESNLLLAVRDDAGATGAAAAPRLP